jgi:hypothetical protein
LRFSHGDKVHDSPVKGICNHNIYEDQMGTRLCDNIGELDLDAQPARRGVTNNSADWEDIHGQVSIAVHGCTKTVGGRSCVDERLRCATPAVGGNPTDYRDWRRPGYVRDRAGYRFTYSNQNLYNEGPEGPHRQRHRGPDGDRQGVCSADEVAQRADGWTPKRAKPRAVRRGDGGTHETGDT